MTNDIGQSFLSDAKTFGLDDGIDAPFQRVSAKTGMEASQRSLSIGVPSQSRFEAEVVQHRGAQVQRQIVNLFEDLANGVNTFLQTPSQRVLAGIFQRGMEVEFGDSKALADFVVQLASD